MPEIGVVRVDGLKELRRDLKAVDVKLDRKLGRHLKAAAQLVADAAKAKVPTGPDVGGHAADSIKAGVNGAKAYVKGGKDDVPYYGWLDFGTRTPNGGQFSLGRQGQAARRGQDFRRVGPWANSGKGPKRGRFIYPALDEVGDKVDNQIRIAVDEALKEVRL